MLLVVILVRRANPSLRLNTPEFSHKRDSLPKIPTVIAARVVNSHGKAGNGLDMVAAAAAQVVARAREAEGEMAEVKHAGEPPLIATDVDGVEERRSSSNLAPVAEGCHSNVR